MTFFFKYIVVRKEIKLNEYRVPLVPIDCNKLIKMGVVVYVEKNDKRCIDDNSYVKSGCILIDNIYKLVHPKDTILVIGIKELDIDNNDIFSYKHMYFSHTYKNQIGYQTILNLFKKNNGTIFDLEYFTDKFNNRLFAFGHMAGIAGCYLGLLQYYNRKRNLNDIVNVEPFNSSSILINNSHIITNYLKQNNIVPSIAIIGCNGRSGFGCIKLLKLLNLDYTGYTTDMSKNDLHNFNIILNCIHVTKYIEPFITYNNLNSFINTDVVVDISCDYSHKYNPFPIYNRCTTFINPIIKVSNIDIIAIENLPSLLPIESSTEFSHKLVDVINNTEYNYSWDKVNNLYIDNINNLN